METTYNAIDRTLIQYFYYISHSCAQCFEKSLEGFDITFPQTIILIMVCRNEDKDYCQKDIANIFGIKASSISSLINNLSKKGLITRKKCQGDTRKYIIKCTDKGRELYKSIMNSSEFKNLGVFDKITYEEKKQLLKILLKIV